MTVIIIIVILFGSSKHVNRCKI